MSSSPGTDEKPSGRPRPDDRTLLAAGLVCFLGYLVTSPAGDVGPLADLYRGRHLLVASVQWTFFAIALLGVRSAVRRGGARLVLVVLLAAACQVPGLLAAPRNSNDAYRYVWDGRVQLAGVSPYRYVPLDDRLAGLRDPILFPGLTARQHSGVRTEPRLPADPQQRAALTRADPRIALNRPGVPTIYPPVAQAWFTAVAAVTPWRAGTAGLQWAAALLALTVTARIGRVLVRRGLDPAPVVIWGWSPLGVMETGSGAHVDVLAAALIVAAMIVLDRPVARTRLLGGLLIGLAIATKIIPVLVLPAVTVLRRRRGGGPAGLLVPVSAVVTALLSYLPHVLVVGSLVLGYLPGYLTEEGFSDGGGRYQLLALFLPAGLLQPVALLLTAALGVVVLWRASPERPESAALWMYGGALLISTPQYPWYCLPLLALAALARRPEWLAVGVATQFAYIVAPGGGPAGWAYLAAAVLVGVAGLRTSGRRFDRNGVLAPVRSG